MSENDDSKPKPPRRPYGSSPGFGSSSDLDRQLRAYLEEAARDREEGNTIANIRIEMHQLRLDMNEFGAEQRVMRLRLDRHGRDIREIKRRLDMNADAEVDTGVHQVEDLKRHLAAKEAELKERRDSSVWWRRQKWQWAAAALGGLVVLALGGTGTVIWFLITHLIK